MYPPSVEQRRHERYDRIYFSPHMDDVAYSCAGRILQERAEGKSVLVVTLFGTGKPLNPGEDGRGSFDRYSERLQEEQAAMQALDADLIWLNRPELLFRKKSASDVLRHCLPVLPTPEEDVQAELHAWIRELCQARLEPDGELFFPLAVGFHPDHCLLFEVGRALHASTDYHVCFYEDLPYARVIELATLRRKLLGDTRPRIDLVSAATETVRKLVLVGKLRWLMWPGVLLHLCLLVAIHRLQGAGRRVLGEPELQERPIDDVVSQKAEVMRLYPSQTEIFFTLGEGLADMLRRQGRFVERSWKYPRHPQN